MASHPIPALGVPVIAAGLAIYAGAQYATALLIFAVFLIGQLSIGWSNDFIDAARDQAVNRRDKPVVAGLISAQTLRTAAILAATITVPISFLLGPIAAAWHLVLVAGGWVYNAALKSTAWSWVPYALAFGALPLAVWFAVPPHRAPAWWLVLAAAVMGSAAHFANVLPDLAADRATGVRGLPHRWGRLGSAVATLLLLLTATALVTVAPGRHISVLGWAVLTANAIIAGVGIARPHTKALFWGAIAIAVSNVVVLIAGR